MKTINLLLAIFISFSLAACTSKENKKEVWIYTSLYKDTISDITPRLEKAFPGVTFNFFQAGSEEVAAKVNSELLAGNTKADILISSDRFWYEELGSQGKLHSYKAPSAAGIPDNLKSSDGWYSTLSIPVMILAYNQEAMGKDKAPESFKALTDAKWKGKITIGSPLASGTNFTTVAFLQKKYGWDYFKALRKNEMISEGGNSAVLKRIQTKEKPIGWVLLENVLRVQDKDDRLKVVFPLDGVVLQNNVVAIVKKIQNDKDKTELTEKVVEWLYQQEGQEAMVRSFMYSPFEKYQAPKGAPPLADIKKKAFAWSNEFIKETLQSREKIKEQFSKITYE